MSDDVDYLNCKQAFRRPPADDHFWPIPATVAERQEATDTVEKLG
jgi:hypothetical protein